MVILFKSTKDLVITSKATIIQKENLADKLNFYVPVIYDDNDMSVFTPTLFYKDGGNEVHSEELVAAESDKENYLKYTVPVTTAMTQKAGTVELWLVFKATIDVGSGSTLEVEIHSSSTSFVVEEWNEYVIADSLAYANSKIESLESEISTLKAQISQLLTAANISA